ncbi:MAG TPA: primosomal protein N' [Candidatus Magasanikbacteria bacterium]|nr:MAG: primosomal protein N' [Candidatus Magasanikbacteria bacterium RIFCSPLOWO2_02_FULL_47_16]OGH79893.1 MAG: primosomal protein N' [Candidatus Magasanikbacteria bacterium RIFCSPHIGHO2_02_FULL_48_18]HAZ28634.1 primosomal protein N' [Candidatus Magasanikbacteria bacterium]
MIAHVVPLLSLPKRFLFFDYAVPPDLQTMLRAGHLVSIPFRSQTVFGVVCRVSGSPSEETPKHIKNILGIIGKEPVFSPPQWNRYATIHAWYGTPLSTVIKMALLPLQKRKLRAVAFSALENTKKILTQNTTPTTYATYHTAEEERIFLSSIISSQKTTLILVPEVRLIDTILSLLPQKEHGRVVSWHGALSAKEQFERWLEIRNSKKTIIIGTRSAVFLPFPKLDTIIIAREEHPNHKQWDQSPRFHVKDIVALLKGEYNATAVLMSFSPSCEAYYAVHKHQWNIHTPSQQTPPSSSPVLFPQTKKHIHIVNMADEKRGKNFSFLSEPVKETLEQTRGDVFLFLNRLGYASLFLCQDCGHKEICERCSLPLVAHEKTHTLHCHYCRTEKPQPPACKQCGSSRILSKGYGTEQVETALPRLLANASDFDIVRIDSETDAVIGPAKKPRIIIGTDMAFPSVDWKKTKTIVFLNIDTELGIPEYLTHEHVWHKIQHIQFYQSPESAFFIQTHNPSHLIFRSLNEPDRFYRTELNQRRALRYPPYCFLVKYFFGHADMRIAKEETERVYRFMRHALTKEKKQITLSPPIEMHPRYRRKKFWYTLIVKLETTTWKKDLIWCNHLIPEQWKIDPNPISLLSP